MIRTRTRSVILSILFFSSLFAKSQPPVIPNSNWEVVTELTDEFNDTELDNEKWLNYQPYWSGREPSQFDTKNVSVSDGYLKLKSTVSNYEQTGNWIASACVSSITKAMQPGYYSEARIKCPELSMTGAFWFQGSYSEIDVIENFGAPTAPEYAGFETSMNTTLHYFADGWENVEMVQWFGDILPTSCADTFYTYGAWFKDSTTVIFYLDGQEVHTSKPSGYFKENMHMFFDMEAFSWGVGFPTIESLDDPTKNTQYVDWVHTFKFVSTTGIHDITGSDKDIYAYPNPTSGSFQINQEGEAQVEIYTLNGALVLRKQIAEGETIYTGDIPVGFYVVKIINSTLTTTCKLIIN